VIARTAVPAFAPAPFPRSKRDGDREGIDMARFQGTWKVISMEIVEANNRRNRLSDWGDSGITGVRVKGNQWTYLQNGGENASYLVNIDTSQKPTAINWYTGSLKEQPGMLGLIRRDGDKVTILYYSTTPDNRPRTFENPPVGWWVLTLRRGG